MRFEPPNRVADAGVQVAVARNHASREEEYLLR